MLGVVKEKGKSSFLNERLQVSTVVRIEKKGTTDEDARRAAR
jgi:hypothetical protein